MSQTTTDLPVGTSEVTRTLFRVEEVAQILAMSKSTVRSLTTQGILPCRRIGRLVRYAQADIDFFVRSRQDFPYR